VGGNSKTLSCIKSRGDDGSTHYRRSDSVSKGLNGVPITGKKEGGGLFGRSYDLKKLSHEIGVGGTILRELRFLYSLGGGILEIAYITPEIGGGNHSRGKAIDNTQVRNSQGGKKTFPGGERGAAIHPNPNL